MGGKGNRNNTSRSYIYRTSESGARKPPSLRNFEVLCPGKSTKGVTVLDARERKFVKRGRNILHMKRLFCPWKGFNCESERYFSIIKKECSWPDELRRQLDLKGGKGPKPNPR